MANVLITGIAGFIGSNLARALLAEGAEVRGVDDFSTGKAANLNEIRGQIDFREASLLDAKAMREACEGVEFVFHEAALPSVAKSMKDPLGTNEVNVDGTLRLLEAARAAGVKRVVYAASSSAYGETPGLPKREDMLPAPISPYGVQKLAGEQYMAAYWKAFGLDTVSLRYFNVFGPRQNPESAYSGVLARFITQMLQGETPTIFGDGNTSRDFTYIANVLSANLLAAKAGPEVAGRMFNVAAARRVSLLQAYASIARIVGYTGSVNMEAERLGDIRHSLADIGAAEEVFGYRVVADFETGLGKTVEWYRAQMG